MGRSMQVKWVKDTPGGETVETVSPEQINDLIKDQVEHAALVIGGLLIAKKLADTASELALIAGRKYI